LFAYDTITGMIAVAPLTLHTFYKTGTRKRCWWWSL